MNDDEEEKQRQALQRSLILQEADLLIDEGKEWGAIQADKQAKIDRYGSKYAVTIEADFRDKEEAAVKRFNEKRAAFFAHQVDSWEKFENRNHPVETEADQQSTGIEYTPSYRDTVLEFKQQRDGFMKDHFSKMAKLVAEKNLSKEDIVQLLKPDHEMMATMAKSHYRALLGHSDNPFFKASLENEQKKINSQSVEDVAEEEMQAIALSHQQQEREYHQVQPRTPEDIEAELRGREIEEKNLLLEQKNINPVDQTGDLYERMLQKIKDRKRGYEW